jgi:hypothetical protein
MLRDLLLVSHYFSGPDTALYEEDLKSRYGADEVRTAIYAGLLEHRRVPCGAGRMRCVCWLSRKGQMEARQG